MSVDCKGLIIGEITIQEVFEIIRKKFDNNATFDVTERFTTEYGYIDSGVILFNFKDEKRSLHTFYSSSQSDIKNISDNIDKTKNYTQLSLGSWGSSEKIMTDIVREFGGYIDINDCDDIGYQLIACEKSLQLRPVIHMTYKELCDKFNAIVIID